MAHRAHQCQPANKPVIDGLKTSKNAVFSVQRSFSYKIHNFCSSFPFFHWIHFCNGNLFIFPLGLFHFILFCVLLFGISVSLFIQLNIGTSVAGYSNPLSFFPSLKRYNDATQDKTLFNYVKSYKQQCTKEPSFVL